MRFRFACFLLALAFEGLSLVAQESALVPAPVDAILPRPSVWESTPQELERELKELRFQWNSANQDVARSALPGLAFQKHSLSEAILSLRYGKLAEARLLWAVRLGFVREKEIPQASGGHMRIIIGYNTATNEILYSDSWGMGNEEKRMSYDDAWLMTNGLSNLQPVS